MLGNFVGDRVYTVNSGSEWDRFFEDLWKSIYTGCNLSPCSCWRQIMTFVGKIFLPKCLNYVLFIKLLQMQSYMWTDWTVITASVFTFALCRYERNRLYVDWLFSENLTHTCSHKLDSFLFQETRGNAVKLNRSQQRKRLKLVGKHTLKLWQSHWAVATIMRINILFDVSLMLSCVCSGFKKNNIVSDSSSDEEREAETGKCWRKQCCFPSQELTIQHTVMSFV